MHLFDMARAGTLPHANIIEQTGRAEVWPLLCQLVATSVTLDSGDHVPGGLPLRTQPGGIPLGSGDMPAAYHRAIEGNHPDLIVLDRGGRSILADDIREEIRAAARIRPFESAHKVFLICNGETMNRFAQNALLALLEEPPQWALFFILTESREALLPTVRSRCAFWRRADLGLGDRLPSPDAENSAHHAHVSALTDALRAHDAFAAVRVVYGWERLSRDEMSGLLTALEAALYTAGREGVIPLPNCVRLCDRLTPLRDALEFNIGVGALCGRLATELEQLWG